MFKLIGPKFRSLNISNMNLLKAMPKSNENQRKEILTSYPSPPNKLRSIYFVFI